MTDGYTLSPIKTEQATAEKYDEGKLRYDLLPPDALEELIRVYNLGANKYSDRNWEKGMDYGRIFAALQRHLWEFWKGEDRDEESNLLHLAHAAWGCLALSAYIIRGIGADDRKLTEEPNVPKPK